MWGVIPPTCFKWLERTDSPGALSSLLLKGDGVTQPAPLWHRRPKAATATHPPAVGERLCHHVPASPAQHLGLLSFGGDTCTLSTNHFNPCTISTHRANQHHPQRPGPGKPTQPPAHLNPLPMPMVDPALHQRSSVAWLVLCSQPTVQVGPASAKCGKCHRGISWSTTGIHGCSWHPIPGGRENEKNLACSI